MAGIVGFYCAKFRLGSSILGKVRLWLSSEASYNFARKS